MKNVAGSHHVVLRNTEFVCLMDHLLGTKMKFETLHLQYVLLLAVTIVSVVVVVGPLVAV